MTNIQFIKPPAGLVTPPFSFAARVGQQLFISGIPGFDETGTIPAEFDDQFRNVVVNLKKICTDAGCNFRDIFKANVFLTRSSDIQRMNELYAVAFGPGPYPARTTCVIQALPHPPHADRD